MAVTGLSWDCHVEVLDPVRWKPCTGVPTLQPQDATMLRKYLQRQRRRFAVLVQPAAYGSAHGCLLDALRLLGAHAVGVAEVTPHDTLERINSLAASGVRAARVTLGDTQPRQRDRLIDDIARVAERLPAGWPLELVGRACVLASMAPVLAHWPRVFVGVPLGRPGPRDDHWPRLCWWAEMGNLYVKHVAGLQTGHGAGLGALLARGIPLDRLVWGSGWPTGTRREDLPATGPLALELDRNARQLYGMPVATAY